MMAKNADAATAWIYKGVWHILVKWFAVPDQPPDLPCRAGETLERFRPSLNFIRYLKLWFWLGLTAIDGLLLIGWIASFFVSVWLGIALAPVFFALAILPDIVAFVGIHLRYDTTWYVLGDRSIRIRRGIWTIHEATITFENVQDLKVEQGPVERHFGIANVILQTAGGGGGGRQKQGGGSSASHKGLIEGVGNAERIRDVIMARVRQSRTAGLGDEELISGLKSRRQGLAWTTEHVSELRAIRDELATPQPWFNDGGRDSRRLSYISPKAGVKNSPIQGKGLFAVEPIAKGEVVCVKGGYIFNRRTLCSMPDWYRAAEVPVAEDLFIGPLHEGEREGSMIFSNHSCEPNIGVRGQIVFVAMRDIAPGEELTHDWATTDDDDYELECKCGAATCRKFITGQDWRKTELQRKYRGYMSWYLEEKIARS